MSSTHSREQWLPLLSGASYTTSPKQNQATRLDPKPRLPRHSRTAAVNSDEVAFPPGVSMEANWSQFTAAQGARVWGVPGDMGGHSPSSLLQDSGNKALKGQQDTARPWPRSKQAQSCC